LSTWIDLKKKKRKRKRNKHIVKVKIVTLQEKERGTRGLACPCSSFSHPHMEEQRLCMLWGGGGLFQDRNGNALIIMLNWKK
jgi:hypothetical protein